MNRRNVCIWRQSIHRLSAPLRDLRLPSLILGLRRVVRLVCSSGSSKVLVMGLVMVSLATEYSEDWDVPPSKEERGFA